MKRIAGGVAVLSLLAVLAGACDDSGGGVAYVPASSGGYGGYSCSAYVDCGSCAAAPGCGWCQDADGRGLCGWGPDACPSSTFTWTWEASGCRTSADASVAAQGDAKAADVAAPRDGQSRDAVAASDAIATDAVTGDALASDGGAADGGMADADAVSSADGCAVNAGNLCTAAAPFGLTCTTTHPFEASVPTPDPSLGCTILAVPTVVGSAYFCCSSAP
jgi:hypothetical protein